MNNELKNHITYNVYSNSGNYIVYDTYSSTSTDFRRFLILNPNYHNNKVFNLDTLNAIQESKDITKLKIFDNIDALFNSLSGE